MTQYDDRVERQRLMLEAKEWQKGVQSLHAHSLDSMAYASGRKDGSVLDISYNDGLVKREIRETGETVYFGKRLTGNELLNDYQRKT
tara:strand:+ start:1774 stop:2034 length:261 start_codon:yes stop_codon:yes gene_type:complete